MDRKYPPEGHKVTPANDVALASDWADILERQEARRSGVSLESARQIVSRKTGVPAGKLYSLRRNRLKSIARHILNSLGERVIAELQSELRHIEHDYQTAIQIGADPRSGEVQTLLASRAKIRDALGLPPNGEGGG